MANLLRVVGFIACLVGIGVAVAGFLYPEQINAVVGVPVAVIGMILVSIGAINSAR